MSHLAGGLIAIAIGIALLVLLALLLQWLWNTTMPEVMGVGTLTTVQAIKLMFICAILFGGHRVVTIDPPEDIAPAGTYAAPKG